MNLRHPPRTAYSRDSATTYDENRFATPAGLAVHTQEVSQLTSVISTLKKPLRVLEVGCGTGRFLEILAGYDEISLVGIDPSEPMLEEASHKVGHLANVTLKKAEGSRLDEDDDSFDMVYCIRVTNQTESPEYALELIGELMRVCRPGGQVLIEFVNRRRSQLTGTTTTTLDFQSITGHLSSKNTPFDVLRKSGLFFLSMRTYEKVPSIFIPTLKIVDSRLSRWFPSLASRNYLLLKKLWKPST